MLEAPDKPALLYEYRQSDEPAPDTRPLAQGDVLRAVTLRDGEVLDLAMIVAHPCSMRQGGKLRERLVVAEVAPHQKVPARKWPTGLFDFFPLPDLEESGQPVSVYFHHLHSLATKQLESCERVAVLTEYGQMVLLQRWIYHMARLVVAPQELTELIVPVQNELSMQMDWVEAGLDAGRVAEEGRAERIAQLSGEFQGFIGEPSDPASLRRRLSNGELDRVYVRRAVRTEIKRRYPST